MEKSRGLRFLTRILLVVTAVGGGSLPTAQAAVVRSHLGADGDINGNGNGRHNHNAFIIDSPSQSHDIQHIRNLNVGGNTLSPAAICKKTRRCRIIQRLVVSYP